MLAWFDSVEQSLMLFLLQALAHSSGYDSSDEDVIGEDIGRRQAGGMRGARSEEFLDRGHLEGRRQGNR